MKRFWRDAQPQAVQGGFTVRLDGRPMRLPGGGALLVPQRALAEAIAREWGEAAGEVPLEALPLTRLAGTALHRVTGAREACADALAAYGADDLLCYRAEAPAGLVRRQAEAWDPWLDWAAGSLGVRLRVAAGVMPREQDAAALARLRVVLRGEDAWAIAGLGIVVPLLGSVVLGLAVRHGALSAEAAHAAATVDECWEEARWGEDAEATARRAAVAADLAAAGRFLRLAAAAAA